eukprot:TRINITY_DN24374_c0_g1_i1.p1 TRINITY_DN24374_c0_g1~~TRINITY_DN24374_c0_g1_i1.p1  ORF type:complete len:641 (-),score=169.83 TRINITY_DN24374_c0_g1_i1:32-1954(-)
MRAAGRVSRLPGASRAARGRLCASALRLLPLSAAAPIARCRGDWRSRSGASAATRLGAAEGTARTVATGSAAAAADGGGGDVGLASAARTLKFTVGAEACALARSEGPLALYESLVEAGQLRPDEEQRRVLQRLNAIYFGAAKRTARGLYLYGSVGCGKSMAMDLFFASVKGRDNLRVQRKHFHEFLYDVQRLLFRLKQESDAGVATGLAVERAGERIAAGVDVLCFDEFAITTIQDCCILLPLFNALWRRGVTVIATSNRAPEDLYTDGLNRHLYLPPFLALLHENCAVHNMQSKTDYRSVQFENSEDAGVFCWPVDRSFVDQWWLDVAPDGASAGGSSGAASVAYGRSIAVPQLSPCGAVARFSFEDLCEQHLAADDYNAICAQFHTILLDGVPCLTVDRHNEARRLTLLIDCCYEHHIRLICSMEGPPEAVLGPLAELKDIGMRQVGAGMAGCGDGDSAPSSSGVLGAISRIKASIEERKEAASAGAANASAGDAAAGDAAVGGGGATEAVRVAAAEVLAAPGSRTRSTSASAGADAIGDIAIWRQDEGGEAPGASGATQRRAPPQVSKAWDDRRRVSSFTWESTDPTSEQQSIKGVFVAAVASLQESGFAVDRAISRLREMQTVAFQAAHREKHQL